MGAQASPVTQEEKIVALIDMFIDLGENAFSYNEAVAVIDHAVERKLISQEKAEYLKKKVTEREGFQTRDNEDKVETIVDVMINMGDSFTYDDALKFVDHARERGAISEEGAKKLHEEIQQAESKVSGEKLQELKAEVMSQPQPTNAPQSPQADSNQQNQ